MTSKIKAIYFVFLGKQVIENLLGPEQKKELTIPC